MSDAGPPAGDDDASRPGARFDASVSDQDLKGRFIRGGAVVLVSQVVVVFVKLGATAALARLLAPDDFGVLAMVVAVTRFVGLFKDLGLSMATVQRHEIDHRQVSTLFWVNVAISILLAFVCALLAPVVGAFYEDARLPPVMLVLATGFLFGGLGVQHRALLRRQMRFRTLATISVVSETLSFGLAIVLAVFGAHYWALVAQVVAAEILRVLGLWIASDWYPGPPVKGSGVRSMLAFGGNLTASTALSYVARNLDKILIGKRWGSGPLGLYATAYRLLLLPMQQINAPLASAAIPTLSRLQSQPRRFVAAFTRIFRFLCYLIMPSVAVATALAPDLVLLVLGPRWMGVAGVFRALAIPTFLQPLASVRWAIIALGRTDRLLKWTLIAVPAICLSYVVGLPRGPIGVAVAYACVHTALQLPRLLLLFRGTPLSVRALLDAAWRPALLGLVIGATMLGARRAILPDDRPLSVGIALVVGGAAALLLLFVVPGYRHDLREIRSTFAHLGPGRGPTVEPPGDGPSTGAQP